MHVDVRSTPAPIGYGYRPHLTGSAVAVAALKAVDAEITDLGSVVEEFGVSSLISPLTELPGLAKPGPSASARRRTPR